MRHQILALTAAVLIPVNAAEKAKATRPNVIYILADDLGYGDLQCYGQTKIKTPHLDKLASQGMLFTQHYAGCTVSAPSRCALMTGYHTGHGEIRGNKRGAGPEMGEHPISDKAYTLAELFKENGYITGCFGKWGLGFPGSEGEPMKQGFDRFFGYNSQTLAHNYYATWLWDNDKKIQFPENENGAQGCYLSDLIHQKALGFVETNKSKPFFAFLSYILPHAELVSPDDSIKTIYKGIFPEKPWKGTDAGPTLRQGPYQSSETPHADFASMVTRLDAYVGNIIQQLETLGIANNTIIVFSSDNGPHKEGGADPLFFNSAGPLKGTKRDVTEGGIRVPMIIRWDGHIQAGSTTDHISAFWDILPTMAEIVKADLPQKTDGISMLPTLLGKREQPTHNYLYWEFHEQGGKQALRKGNWKAIRLNVGENRNGVIELYDLTKDLREEHNIAAQHPQVVKELTTLMDGARTESEHFNFGK